MKINPIGNGFPKINKGVKTLIVLSTILAGGARLITRKDRKK